MKRVEGESVICLCSHVIFYCWWSNSLAIWPSSDLSKLTSSYPTWISFPGMLGSSLPTHMAQRVSSQCLFYAVSVFSLPIKSYLSSNSSTKHHFSRKTMSLSQSLNIFLVRTLIAFIVWTMPHSIDYCSSDLMLVNLLISTLRTKRMIYIIFYTVGAQYYWVFKSSLS